MFFGASALTCFCIIVAIYVVVYWLTPRKAVAFPFLLIVVLFSVLAYHIEPHITDDLARYFSNLDYLRENGYDGLKYAFEQHWNSWNIYRMCGYYFYFISRLPNNYYMSAITMFIVYGLMFLVLYKAAQRFNVNKLYLFLGSMFFISTYWYYDTASGIRNGLTFAVVFACAYFHLVERKYIPLCCVGYVLACLTHSAGIMPVAFVVLTEFTLNTSGKFLKYALVFGLAGGGLLMNYLSQKTDNEFVQSIAGKAEKNAPGGAMEVSTFFIVNLVTYLVVAVVLMYVSRYITKGDYAKDLKRLYKYSSITMYFLLGSLYSGLIFARFTRWIVPIIGALFFMIGMQIQSDRIGDKRQTYYFNMEKEERILTQMRSFFIMFYVAYTCVHLWYLVVGSSLNWITFIPDY